MNRIRTTWPSSASIAVAVVFLLLNAQGAQGQSAGLAMSASRAQDPQGVSVANATVTATNLETGIFRTTQTYHPNNVGRDQSTRQLTPGVYDIVIEARSVTKVEAKNERVLTGEQRDINFNLVPAGDKQSLVVTAELRLIESTKTASNG